MSCLKFHLHQLFNIKDLGRLHYFLRLKVDYLDYGIMLSQKKFVHELLSTDFLDVSKPASPLYLFLISCLSLVNLIT